jgi:diguanylate cyclase (GGDEF)-like protein
MTLDVRTFWLIGALVTTSCGLLVLILRKQYADHLGKSLVVFGTANVLLGLNYVLRLQRAHVGDFFFYDVAGTLVTLCLSLEYLAVCLLKQQPPRRAWIYGPPAVVFAACCWFTFAERSISIALIICNVANMVLMILIAITFARKEDQRRPFPDMIAAGGYAWLAMITLVVIVDALKGGHFPVEYDFNVPRSILNNIAAILAEGIIFSIFLLSLSERLNYALIDQAMHDPLTGAYNRRAFEVAAFREISGALRSGSPLSLLVIDLDGFKEINDLYGHDAGDDVLRASADVLRKSLRDEDLLCRWGGDEFCVLLPRAQRRQAEAAAQRLLKAFENSPFSIARTPVRLSVSIGIAQHKPEEHTLSPLFTRADAALYHVKENGGNAFAFGGELESVPEVGTAAVATSMALNPPNDLPSNMA